MQHIVIIGNGISGITAARHIRKNSSHRITVISAETDHFYSRTALMYIYMGHMKYAHTKPYEDWFWEKNRIELKRAFVNSIDTTQKQVHFENGEKLNFDKLVIATGSKSNKFGWPGQDLNGVQGLYNMQDLELLEKNTVDTKRAVIVGGGLIGIELAEMLRSRDIPVTFLVRETNFWDNVLPDENSKLLNKHILSHHIDLRLGVNLEKINADDNGRTKSVTVKETGEEIDCTVVGLTAGVSPNVDFLKDTGIELGKGVKVNRYLETNVEDIYAIGDCAEQHEGIGLRRPIEAVWYTGRMMGETVAQTVCGTKTQYNPGHWFNSAKFLDIEYQTYGWVFSDSGKKKYEQHFHWSKPEEDKAITIAYHKESGEFLGINTFGVRLRHEIMDQWLTEKRDVNFVVQNLSTANFDPEFYRRYESEILNQFNKQLQPA